MKNLIPKILKKNHPALAALVQNGGEDARVSLQDTPSGAPTLIVQTSGKTYALHHPEDPLGHARQWLESRPEWKKARNIAVLGCGLGYIPILLHRAQPKLQHLFVLEPSLSVFRQALRIAEMQPLLVDPRVHFVVGSEPGAVYKAMLQCLMDLVANPLFFLGVASITTAFPEWARSAEQEIQDVLRLGKSGLRTKFRDAPLTLHNLFRNLAAVAAAPGLNSLEERLHGVPAIIVAAGPSLKKNIQDLKKAGDHFLIIATDTAFEPLRRAGVTPHLVVTVDPTELNLKHFQTSAYGPETVLLFDPEARPELPPRFSRWMTFLTDKHPFFEWLKQRIGDKGMLHKGGMVSQAGIYAAHYWGCRPIILAGQDLALDPDTGDTHDPRTALCRNARYLEGDMNHVDFPRGVDESGADLSREALYWVEGVDGRPVPTLHNLLVYLRMLEEDIRMMRLDVIDATEGGAKIQGTRILRLADAIARYWNDSIDVRRVLDKAGKVYGTHPDSTIPIQLLELMHTRVEIAHAGLQYLNQCINQAQSNLSISAISGLAKEFEEFRVRIFSDPVADYLIEYAAPRELFEFLKSGPADLTDEEERKQLIKRYRALFTATLQAVERIGEWLKAK
ncbi:MAG: motility associated factor glycosyltransferase family protein [bacterium]